MKPSVCEPVGPKSLNLTNAKCTPKYIYWHGFASDKTLPFVEHISFGNCGHYATVWRDVRCDPTYIISMVVLRLGLYPEWTLQHTLTTALRIQDWSGIDTCHTLDGFLSRYVSWCASGTFVSRRDPESGVLSAIKPAQMRDLLVKLCDALILSLIHI